MEHERPHLHREQGDLEQGVADVLAEKRPRHAAPHAAPPDWLVKWETQRPIWLMECIAEAIGVFFYVFAGVGATASFFVTSAAGVEGYGSLLTIGLAYGMGIAFAIIVAAPVSGGHLNPSFTIVFYLFKGRVKDRELHHSAKLIKNFPKAFQHERCGDIFGAFIHTMFLGDTDRILAHLPHGIEKSDLGLQDGEPLTLRVLTRETVGSPSKSPVDGGSSVGDDKLSFLRRRVSNAKVTDVKA
ncbi:hypothetical protein P7C70_g1825, partial [Phenoliferia sp. Uapishka_3]